MKKTLKTLVLSLFFVSIFTINSYAQSCFDNDKAYFTLKESAVSLIIKRKNNKWYTCSGIIIGNSNNSTEILTAQHCVANAKKIYVDKIYVVDSFIEAKTIDVAYLKINKIIEDKHPIKIARYNENWGATIFTLGYPSRIEKYGCGKIIIIGIKNFYSNAKIIHGCSGSGVINNRGELIGILWSGYFSPTKKESSTSVFIKIEHVLKFLKTIRK